MLERIEPQDGQLSAWDFPRPPIVEKVDATLKVVYKGKVIAETTKGFRVLEKYLAPSYYFPREDIKDDFLQEVDHATFCRHTGTASYYNVVVDDDVSERACWSYVEPNEPYAEIAGYIAFYPSRVDACYVNEEQAESQHANYYGGWITEEIVGPFSGDPGIEF
ncbi:MAG: DUF427 domain-containing protein [Chloroflexota bacterium]